VVIDLLVLDSIRRSMTGGGLGIVCDEFVRGDARRAAHRLWLEGVDAGHCALALAHVLVGPYFLAPLARLRENEAYSWRTGNVLDFGSGQ
jgi:hypothetical protein